MNRSQLKRDFTPQQIIQLVLSLGSSDYKWDQSMPDEPAIFQTICHNHPHEGSYKLYYYPDSQSFHCYTQCSDNFDIYELVMRSRKCSFIEALYYIQSTLNIEVQRKVGFMSQDQSTERVDDWDVLEKYARLSGRSKSKQGAATSNLPPNLIDFYSKVYPLEWQQEGITPDTMEKFSIRFSVVNNEVIIPHYDVDGNLIGLRSRSFDPVKVGAGCKYMPTQLEGVDFRHSLRNHLYGLNKTKEAIQRIGKCMFVESEKSVLQCDSFYGDQNFAVAVCGHNIAPTQRDLILNLGVREVFIAFDKEYHEAYSDESDRYADRILRLAGMFTPYVTTYVLWDVESLLQFKDSPTDRGQAVLEHLMKNKFEVETIKESK